MPESGTLGPGIAQPSHRVLRWWSTRRVVVRDESMLPTLRPGDRLLVDRRAYRAVPPRVGEIVVLVDPEEADRWLVKRVAKVLSAAGSPPKEPVSPPAAVSVFVVSDAPGATRDSRQFGPVALTALIGRAYRRYYPADRRGVL
ncbi:MAG TPA: S26 family signal peptidase [Thermoplasmata archaeon]|nr:S26 family signal peptidase [Thermoplasmata archaeon]